MWAQVPKNGSGIKQSYELTKQQYCQRLEGKAMGNRQEQSYLSIEGGDKFVVALAFLLLFSKQS